MLRHNQKLCRNQKKEFKDNLAKNENACFKLQRKVTSFKLREYFVIREQRMQSGDLKAKNNVFSCSEQLA